MGAENNMAVDDVKERLKAIEMAVGQIEKRLREAARMGFTRAIICARNKANLRGGSVGLEVIGVDNVRQALDAALVRR